MGRRARIGDEPQDPQHPVAIEQRRQDHGMPGYPGPGLAARIARLLDGLADILILVVEARIDFVQPIVFRPALPELRPIPELLPRRAAVAAAGEIAETVEGHRLRLEPELQAADFAGVWPSLCLGRGMHEHCDDGDRKTPCVRARADHFFIGSHWRVSWPQNSTQSSYVAGPRPTALA